MLGAQPDRKLEPSNYRSPHLQSTVSKPVITRKPLSKYHLLQPYFEDNYSVEGSSHIALEIERCIKQTRNFQKETPIFVNLIRSRIIYLLQYNLFVASIALLYPLSNSFVQLLLRYVALECKVLYKKEFYTRQYEIEVQQRVYRLLMSIYYAHFESRLVPSSRIYKECSKSIIGLFIKLKTDYGVKNKLIENIIVGLLRRTGDLDKVIALKGTHQPCSSDSYLDNANLVNVCGDVITNDYGSDDIFCSSSTHNDVQLCSADDWDRDSRNSSKSRAVPTICIDDDDVETVYFERECKPSERTIRKLAEKSSPEVKVERVFALHKPLVENVAVIKNENKQDDIYEKPYTSYETSVENIVQKTEISDEVVVIDDENHSYTVNENVAQVSNIYDNDQAFSSPHLRSAPIGGNKTSNCAQFQKRQSVKIEELDSTEKLDKQYPSKDANVNFQPKCEVVDTHNIDLTVDDDDDDVIEFCRVKGVIPKAEVNDSVNEHTDQSFKDAALNSNVEKPTNEDGGVIPVPSIPSHCVIDLTEDDKCINVSTSTLNTKGIKGDVGIDTNKRNGVGDENDVSGVEDDPDLSQNTRGVTNLPARIIDVEESEEISNRPTASSNSHNFVEVAESANDKRDHIDEEEKGTYLPQVSNEVTHLSMVTTKSVALEQSSSATKTSISCQLDNVEGIVGEGSVIVNKQGRGELKQRSSIHKCNEQEISDLEMKNNCNTTPLSTNQLDKDTCYQGVVDMGVELEETSNKTKIASNNYQVNTVKDIVAEAIVNVYENDNIQELVSKEPSKHMDCLKKTKEGIGVLGKSVDIPNITASDSQIDITDIHEEIQVAPCKKDAVGIKEATTKVYSNNQQSNTADWYHEDNIEDGSVLEQCEQQQNLGLKNDCSTSSVSKYEDKEAIYAIEESVDASNTNNVSSADSQIDIRRINEDVRTVPREEVAVFRDKEEACVLEGIEDSDFPQKSNKTRNLTLLTRPVAEFERTPNTENVSSNDHKVNAVEDIIEVTDIIANKKYDIEVEACEQQEAVNSELKNICSISSDSKNEDKDMHSLNKLNEGICVIDESADTSDTIKVSAVDSQIDNRDFNEEARAVTNKEDASNGEKETAGVLEEIGDKTKKITLTTRSLGESESTSSTEEVSSIIHQVNFVEDIIEEASNIEIEADLQGCDSDLKNKNQDMNSSNNSGEMMCVIEEYVDTSNTNYMPSTDSHINITDGEVKTVPNEEVAVVGEKEAAGVLEGIEDADLLKSKETSNFTLRTGLVEESDSIPSTEQVYSNSDQVDLDENISNKTYDIVAQTGLEGCEQELINVEMVTNCSISSSSKSDGDMNCLKVVPNENGEVVESSGFLPENAKEVTNAAIIEESGGTPITMVVSCHNCQINPVEGNLEEVSVDINEKDDDFEGRLPIDSPCSPELEQNETKTNINSPTDSAPLSTKSKGDTDFHMTTRRAEETEDISKTLDYPNLIAEERRVNVNTKNDKSAKVPFAVEECKPNQSVDCKIKNDGNTTTVSTIPEGNIYPAEFQVEASDEVGVNEEKEAPANLEIKYDAVEAEKNVSLISDIQEPTKLSSITEFNSYESDVVATKNVVEELGATINTDVLKPSKEGATDLESETGYVNLPKCSEETTDCVQEVGTATKFVEIFTIPESSSVAVHNEFCPTVGESNSALSSLNDDFKIMEETPVETSYFMEIASNDPQIDIGEEIVEVITSEALTVVEEVVVETEIPTDDHKTMTLATDVYFEAASAEAVPIKLSISGNNEDLPLATVDKKDTPLAELTKTVICKELVVKLEQLNMVTIKNRDGSGAKRNHFRSADVGIDDNIVVTGFQNLLSEIKVDELSPILEESSDIVKNKNQDSVITTKFKDNARFGDLADDLNTHDELVITDETEVIEDTVYDVYNEDTVDETLKWCYSIKIQASNCVADAQHTQTKTSTSQCSEDAVFRPLRTMAERKLYYKLNPDFVNENCSDIQQTNEKDAISKSLDALENNKEEASLEAGEKSAAVDVFLQEVPKSPVSTDRMPDMASKMQKVDEVLPKPTDKPSTFPSKHQYQSNEKSTETKTGVSLSKSKIELPSHYIVSKSSRNVSENNPKNSSGNPDDVSKISGIKTIEKTSKSRDNSIISKQSSSSDRSHKSRSLSSDKERKSKSKFVNEVTTTKNTTSRSDTEQLGIAKPTNELEDKIVKSEKKYNCDEMKISSGLELGHVKNIPVDKTESSRDKLKVLCDYKSKSKSTSNKISAGHASSAIVGSIGVLRRVEDLKHKRHSKKSSRSRSRSSDRRSNSSSEFKSGKYHSKTKHDKSLSGEAKYLKRGSENAGKDNRDISLNVHKDKKYPLHKPRDSKRKDKEASSKEFFKDDKLKEKHRHIDSKTKSYMLKESKPSSIVHSNLDKSLPTVSVEAPSKMNIARDSTVEIEMPTISTTATSQSQLGTNLRSSDLTALDAIVKENNKMERVDSHELKPEDNMVEKSDRQTNTTCAEREVDTSIVASEVIVFEDCSLHHKSPELLSKQDLVNSMDVIEEHVLNPNTNYEEVCSSNVPQKQNVSSYIDVIDSIPLASSMDVCQTDLKIQGVDILSKSYVNECNISKNTRDDRETHSPVQVVGKGEENLQPATKTTDMSENSVFKKKVGDVLKRIICSSHSSIEDTDEDETSREHRQKTDETARSTSKLETSKAAYAGVDKSQLAVSSSPLDLPSYFENCDEKCSENPESSRLELDYSKVEECSLNTLTEKNGTSNDNVHKQNGMHKKRRMEISDSTTVKRVKSEDEVASGKKVETSMESIINEMKENVSISQSEDIDVSAMKRKLSDKIYNKPSIPEPELNVELPEPDGVSQPVPPADFDIFDAETDPTGQIEEQPSSCAELHDVSVGAALDQISFLNNSLDASAIERSILEKVKFIDDLEPHNVSDYARYPDEAQPLNRDVDATATPQLADCEKARVGTGVSEHATQSSTVNFGDLSNIILSSEDIGILSKMIRTLTPVDTSLTPTTTSTAVTNVSEQIETSESWAIIDANLSSSFPDISPMKMFIDRNALTISSDNNISGTPLTDKNLSVTPSLAATDCPPPNGGCTPTTIERDHGDVNDHNYYAGARGLLECSKTNDNCNVSVGASNNPNDSVDNGPKMDSSKDPNDSAENAPAESNSSKGQNDSTDNAQEIDTSFMSGVKSESGSTQKINIDNEYAIKNLVSLSQSSSDSNDFLPPNSSEVDFLIGLLDTIYSVGDSENKDSDAKCDVHTWNHLMADEEPAHEVLNEERPIEKPVGLDKAANTVTVSTIKVAEEGTNNKESDTLAKSPVMVSSTTDEAPKGETIPKKTKLLILPSGRSPVLAPPKRKPVTTVTVHRQRQSTKLDVKTKRPPADCAGDNLILLPTMLPIEPDKPKPAAKSTPVIPKETKIVEGKQTSIAKNAGVDLVLFPTTPPIISDKSSKDLPSNKSIRKSDTYVKQTVDIINTTASVKTSLQHPPVVLNIFDKIKLEKRAACSRKSPTLADVRNPDNPTAKRTSPNSKMRFQDIKTREKYITKNPSPPGLVAKEHPAKQDKRDNYIIINTDNLLKLKMRPVHRNFQSPKTDNGHNLKRKSPVLGEPTTKLRRVEVVNKDNVFDGTLKQPDVDTVMRLKLAEEVTPRPVHQKRATYGDKYPSGKQATQYRSGVSSNGYKITYHSQDKWCQDKKANSSDSANSRLEVRRLDTDSASPKRRLSSEEISGTSSPYQTHRSTGHNKNTILKRRPHDEPLPTSRLFFPSSSSNVLRTYCKPGVSRRSHLSEDP